MNYPNDFNTPAFPAGKTIAFSRSVSIWISIVLFCVIVACGLVLLLNVSRRNYPFLISTDPITSDWTVVAYIQDNQKIATNTIVQETLVANYVDYWFSIYKNNEINEEMWQPCKPTDCDKVNQYMPGNHKCALFCTSDKDLFNKFTSDVLPEYRNRVNEASETIRVVSRLLTPPTIPDENGGLWQAYVVLESSVNQRFEVLAFIDIAKQVGTHASTMGYYVKDFNAYRMQVAQE